ncbi:MAG: hypothetical protein NTX81_02000 [Candidatus Bathyarchaeota archaeon]|nr:hypothetical protein [Candidatus Bathyarchaeota archaeon]
MGKRSLRSRKGLSTAVGTAFYIIVVLISLSSMWAIGAFQARYQAVTDKMNVWDTERISENLNIRSVSQPVSKMSGQKYDINIVVDNNGGVTVNIARIYVLDQNNNKLNVSDPMNLSATQPRFGFNHSTINTGEVSHVIPVSVTPNLASALSTSPPHECRIILTTDRGRQFSYNYPPPESAPGPSLAYTSGSMKVNYTAPTVWKDPYMLHDIFYYNLKNNKLRVKANFTNISGHDITIASGNVLLQIADAGANDKTYYIGGYLVEGSSTYHDGETFDVIWKITSWSSGLTANQGSLDGILNPYPNHRATILGSTVFSSAPGADFFSAGLLMDGLLVYVD